MSWLDDAWSGVKSVAKTGANVMTGGGYSAVEGALSGGPQRQRGVPAMPGGPTNGGYPVPQYQAQPGYNFQGDFSRPGQAEQFFAQNQNKFTQPTAGASWFNQNAGQFAQPGAAEKYWQGVAGMQGQHPQATNMAQGAYQQFQGQTPADMSRYYNQAQQNAARDINRQFAARGQYGGTGAMNQLALSAENLRAQEARDNAQYGLQRAGLAGNLAQGADASSRGVSQNELAWTQGLGQLAGQAQNAGLARNLGVGNLALGVDQGALAGLNAGMAAAMGAQGAQRNRGQDYFQNTMGYGNALAAPTMGIGLQQIGADREMLDQAIQAALGYPREAVNQTAAGRAASEQGISNLIGMLGGMSGSGGMSGLLGAFA